MELEDGKEGCDGGVSIFGSKVLVVY